MRASAQNAGDARAEDARRVLALADQALDEAKELRRRAAELEREAERLSQLAAAVSGGGTIAGALGI